MLTTTFDTLAALEAAVHGLTPSQRDACMADVSDGFALSFPDELKSAIDAARAAYVPGAPSPAPTAPVITYKVDVIRRASDDEVEQLEGALSAAPARLRLLWNGIQRIEHDAPEFGTLRDAVIAAVGEDRADALLAPSA